MSKYALFAFRGEQMCFLHVLLNALDIHRQGYEVKVVIEGEATKLLTELYDTKNPLYKLYQEVLEKNLLEGICKACSQKFGTYELALQKGLKILDDMANHAGMGRFTKQGYQIITF
ncbi:MAG: DsrE family protein [Thermodesulfovibrio sp.]|nr:DsrE family protein [Thermodesulfovibrio sp.]